MRQPAGGISAVEVVRCIYDAYEGGDSRTPVEYFSDDVEGYIVHVGGAAGPATQAMAREIYPATAFDELPPLLERMLRGYLTHRRGVDESFHQFTRRHDVDALDASVREQEHPDRTQRTDEDLTYAGVVIRADRSFDPRARRPDTRAEQDLPEALAHDERPG